ncbi:MAG: SDR family oxidoreductase [Proteobacteria bacterium]|nr:SDR family oxidoreductase [Pseudomonadota bacterium]
MKQLAVLLVLWSVANASAADITAATEPAPNPGTVLITGSDRGIGLALAREFESRGWQVIATCRDPEKATDLKSLASEHSTVSIEKLDVSDDVAIDALVTKLKDRPIDALVNNAGVTGGFEAQTLAGLDANEFSRVLRVNSYAPLRVSAAFLKLVAASKQRKIIAISSGYGSLASVEKIASYGYPSAYFYAMSKAALNMAMREFAFEAAHSQVITVLLAPGAVDTDMQRGIRERMSKMGKPISAPVVTPEASAHSMVLVIEQLRVEQNAKFLARDGSEIPW